MMLQETAQDLLADLGVASDYSQRSFDALLEGNSRYIKDLRINLKNALNNAKELNDKEVALLGLAVAVNEHNEPLQQLFQQKAKAADAAPEEIADAIGCASLLASNNVLYRFRHFTQKEQYQQLPAGIKMNIMMKPAIGKEFFELISLAISAVNGCEMCVNAHEDSLIKIGATEARIFEAVRISSVLVSATKVIY